MMKTMRMPLLGPPTPELARRFYSYFCTDGSLPESIVPGGGTEILTQYLQTCFDTAMDGGGGLTGIFLHVENGFGSVDHSSLSPLL